MGPFGLYREQSLLDNFLFWLPPKKTVLTLLLTSADVSMYVLYSV